MVKNDRHQLSIEPSSRSIPRVGIYVNYMMTVIDLVGSAVEILPIQVRDKQVRHVSKIRDSRKTPITPPTYTWASTFLNSVHYQHEQVIAYIFWTRSPIDWKIIVTIVIPQGKSLELMT